MTGARPAEILRQLESAEPDAELLARFAATKDAQAFAELVRRHGALVLGVCRRVTGQAQDAEDAFQATFLVLARKAGSLRNGALLGNWLYGVAYRVAWRARRSALRRRKREVPVSALPEVPAPSPSANMPELAPILDEELAALAACYREAIILCDLRGVPREEAAAALGIPEGTLSSRLANGRKKLAARLARRGIALPAAALAGAISEAQAATSVPNELVTKTCGLVADWAGGGAVPGPLARLAEGGLAVRKTLIIGVLMALAVGGAVLAARPDEAPNEPPKPLLAQKSDPAPQPKEEPKPGDKGVTYTNAPKMRTATDIKIGRVSTAAWSNDGRFFAVQGYNSDGAKGGRDEVAMTLLAVHNERFNRLFGRGVSGGDLVGFTPDSRELITQKREYHLVSGFHWLKYEALPEDIERAIRDRPNPMLRTVNLDLPETHGYAFAPDGKTYRTVAIHRDATGTPTKFEILEVDAKTGKSAKSLMKTDFGQHALSVNGKRLAVLDKDATKVTVYDLDRGAKQSEHKFPADGDAGLPRVSKNRIVAISPDGTQLFVSRGPGRSHLLDADNGTPLPLEGTDHAGVYPADSAFTGDGRLFASRGTIYTLVTTRVGGKEETAWSQNGSFLKVWDTRTGKALKTWDKSPRVLFHPTKPLMATLEPHGDNQTRVGFWDFAAEVGKK